MIPAANADQYVSWNGDNGHRWVDDADRRDQFSPRRRRTLR